MAERIRQISPIRIQASAGLFGTKGSFLLNSRNFIPILRRTEEFRSVLVFNRTTQKIAFQIMPESEEKMPGHDDLVKNWFMPAEKDELTCLTAEMHRFGKEVILTLYFNSGYNGAATKDQYHAFIGFFQTILKQGGIEPMIIPDRDPKGIRAPSFVSVQFELPEPKPSLDTFSSKPLLVLSAALSRPVIKESE